MPLVFILCSVYCLPYSIKNNNTLPFRVAKVNTEIAKCLDLAGEPVVVFLQAPTFQKEEVMTWQASTR